MRAAKPEQRWIELLRYNHLESFADIWALPADFLEQPNTGRGGWSAVSRHVLRGPGRASVNVILKRQHRYTRKTWKHPVRGTSTLRAEMEMISRLKRADVPVPEVIYFGEVTGPEPRAALMTLELAGARSLDAAMHDILLKNATPAQKWRLISRAAQAVRKMHLRRCQHRALFPKHLLVAADHAGAPNICIIDLEKARLRLLVRSCTIRDLYALNRRSPGASRTDRLRFLLAYTPARRFGAKERALWRRIARRSLRKV